MNEHQHKGGMTQLQGLPPIADANHSRILILGSFPSQSSLHAQQYYAHPRNQFWVVMEQLFGLARGDLYSDRCRQLTEHRIALWDVIGRCQRQGSLDSKIRAPEANDFITFYRHYTKIEAVFWNGAAAEQHYRALVGESIRPAGCDQLAGIRLPSTSPANAAISVAGKIEKWRVICEAS